MNRTPVTVFVALVAAFMLPHGALADEEGRKSLREECRSIAAGHGVQAERMDAWIERCVENTTRIRQEMEEERRPAPAPSEAPGGAGHGH